MAGKRSRARQHVVQALYQWQLTGQNIAAIEAEFLEDQDVRRFDVPLFRELLHGVPAQVSRLDGALGPFLDREMGQVDPVERAVLRLGAYELLFHPETPYRVVINEAVEMAKMFGAEQGHRYVNGVLDQVAKRMRQVERSAG